MKENLFEYESPFGYMQIYVSDQGVTAITFSGIKQGKSDHIETALHKQAAKELKEYFAGKRKEFSVPLDLQGTDFQVKTWKALKDIPYGKLISYKDLAETVGSPKGYRAVGLANNKNPIPIICACHRVVGSNGKLVGYAYGLDMKEALINMEKEN